MASLKEMWQCQIHNCGYIYDPDKGDPRYNVAPGTPFQRLPDDWRSPFCSASKKMYRPLAGPGSTQEEGKKHR